MRYYLKNPIIRKVLPLNFRNNHRDLRESTVVRTTYKVIDGNLVQINELENGVNDEIKIKKVVLLKGKDFKLIDSELIEEG